MLPVKVLLSILFIQVSSFAAPLQFSQDAPLPAELQTALSAEFSRKCAVVAELATSLRATNLESFQTQYTEGFRLTVLAQYKKDLVLSSKEDSSFKRVAVKIEKSKRTEGNNYRYSISSDACWYSSVLLTHLQDDSEWARDREVKHLNTDLVTYLKKQPYQELGEGKFLLTVKPFNGHIKRADRLAKYLWSKIFPNVRTSEPFPCGHYLDGDIGQSGDEVSYEIAGSGDGGGDSCTGTGGPGWWGVSLKVTYDKANNTASVEIDSGSE